MVDRWKNPSEQVLRNDQGGGRASHSVRIERGASETIKKLAKTTVTEPYFGGRVLVLHGRARDADAGAAKSAPRGPRERGEAFGPVGIAAGKPRAQRRAVPKSAQGVQSSRIDFLCLKLQNTKYEYFCYLTLYKLVFTRDLEYYDCGTRCASGEL